jgi:hypothetical protein
MVRNQGERFQAFVFSDLHAAARSWHSATNIRKPPMKKVRNLILAATMMACSASVLAQANQTPNPAGPPTAGTGATTTPTRGTGTDLSNPNAVNATAVQSSGQSNDPYVQKRQKDAEAKAEYKERKQEAKRQAKMEKRDAKADLKAEKRASTAERNDALAPAATVR